MVEAKVQAIDIDPKTGSTIGFYTFGDDRPNVLLLSGMDGSSASCVYATYLVLKHLESLKRVDGSVTILPVANPLAFRLGTMVSPLDSKNLNSVFPGDEYGTITQRIAWEIWRRASKAEYVLNVQTGTQHCLSYVKAMHREYIHVRNFISQISLPIVVQSDGKRGSLITEAAHDGVPVATIEMRGNAQEIEPQAAVEVREAILNFLRIKDMIPGDPMDVSNTLTGRLQHVNVEDEGFFVPNCSLGDSVRPGDIIGKVEDKGEVTTRYEGRVVSLSRMNYVFEGDIVARVALPLVSQSETENSNHTSNYSRKW
jgi:uncharacterized protein